MERISLQSVFRLSAIEETLQIKGLAYEACVSKYNSLKFEPNAEYGLDILSKNCTLYFEIYVKDDDTIPYSVWGISKKQKDKSIKQVVAPTKYLFKIINHKQNGWIEPNTQNFYTSNKLVKLYLSKFKAIGK